MNDGPLESVQSVLNVKTYLKTINFDINEHDNHFMNYSCSTIIYLNIDKN